MVKVEGEIELGTGRQRECWWVGVWGVGRSQEGGGGRGRGGEGVVGERFAVWSQNNPGPCCLPGIKSFHWPNFAQLDSQQLVLSDGVQPSSSECSRCRGAFRCAPSELADPNKVVWPFSRRGNFLGGIFEVALNTQTETAKADQTETPIRFFSGKAPKSFCWVSVNPKVRSY